MVKIVIEKNKEPVYTYEEYLNLPSVHAADAAEMARMAKREREHSERMEREIDKEYNSQFVKLNAEREKARAEFRQEIIDAVWEHSSVTNGYEGEWTPEFYIPRGHEKEVDAAIDAAWEKLNTKMEPDKMKAKLLHELTTNSQIPLYADPILVDATRRSVPMFELMTAYKKELGKGRVPPKRNRVAEMKDAMKKWIGQHLHSLADRFWIVPYSDGEDW